MRRRYSAAFHGLSILIYFIAFVTISMALDWARDVYSDTCNITGYSGICWPFLVSALGLALPTSMLSVAHVFFVVCLHVRDTVPPRKTILVAIFLVLCWLAVILLGWIPPHLPNGASLPTFDPVNDRWNVTWDLSRDANVPRPVTGMFPWVISDYELVMPYEDSTTVIIGLQTTLFDGIRMGIAGMAVCQAAL